MTIIYFTATGNSLCVAKRMAGKTVSVMSVLRENKPEISDSEAIGIVAPVYFGRLPQPVEEMIGHTRLKAPYIFGILTFGEIAGRAASLLAKAGLRSGIKFDYIRTIKMIDNNFSVVNVDKQIRKAGKKKIDENLDAISDEIGLRIRNIEKPGWLDKIVGFFEELISRDRTVARKFSVETDKCIGCGVCVKVCPTRNISMLSNDHKTKLSPVWHDHCLMCTACYHNCSQGAIRFRGEHSRTTFRNPAVSLEEIIRSNGEGNSVTHDENATAGR